MKWWWWWWVKRGKDGEQEGTWMDGVIHDCGSSLLSLSLCPANQRPPSITSPLFRANQMPLRANFGLVWCHNRNFGPIRSLRCNLILKSLFPPRSVSISPLPAGVCLSHLVSRLPAWAAGGVWRPFGGTSSVLTGRWNRISPLASLETQERTALPETTRQQQQQQEGTAHTNQHSLTSSTN